MKEIQAEFAPDLDEKTRIEISQAYQDTWTAFLIDLERCSNDQLKLECIRTKIKETQQKAYELSIKGMASAEIDAMEMDLMERGLKENPIKFPSVKIGPFTFFDRKSKKERAAAQDELKPGGCAHQYGIKVQKEIFVLYMFYSELKECKAEIKHQLTILQPKALPETPSTETAFEEADPRYTLDCQQIFKDLKAQLIFESLRTNLVGEKTQLADYTFVFRRMQKDGYILEGIKEKTFREFLTHHFGVHFNSKLKPMGYCTTDWKEKMYANTITSIQTR